MSTLTRVGLIGDIHGEHRALRVALRYLHAQHVDAVLAVGDIVDGPGDVDECVALLIATGALVVRGNHERWFLAQQSRSLANPTPTDSITPRTREFLAALPETRTLATAAGLVLLCHGLGRDDMAGVKPDDGDDAVRFTRAFKMVSRAGEPSIILNGHTHQRMVRRLDSIIIINAGTLYEPDNPCFAIVDFEHGSVSFFDVIDRSEIVPAEILAFRTSR